jgi:hypothetical protein
MLPKSVIAFVAASAFATGALMPTGAYATGGLQPGTWKWPPYAEGGNMPRTTCGYVSVNPRPYGPRGQGAMGLRLSLRFREAGACRLASRTSGVGLSRRPGPPRN